MEKKKERITPTVQSRPHGISSLVDQDARIIVEAHERSVGPSVLLFRADDDGVRNVAAAHLLRRCRLPAEFAAEVALLLDYHYDPVACRATCEYARAEEEEEEEEGGWTGGERERIDGPTLAARFILSTFTHSTRAAPELSMQFSIDCVVSAGPGSNDDGEEGGLGW